jgi:NitT/TauT family transport system substrate-binding protein
MSYGKLSALAVTLLSLLATSASAETLKVAVAQRGFWNSMFIEFGLQNGWFKEQGLDIEVLYTEGGASTLTPVIAGSLDIAMTNGVLGVVGAYAKGMPVKIIASEATGAPDAFWYSKPDSGIKTIRDTAGKTVAFSSAGSSTNLIILQLINQENVKPRLVATGGAPGTLTQVMTGQIDVGWAVPPFVLKDLSEGKLQIIARGSDVRALANQTVRVHVANANALKEKRDAIRRFMQVMSRAIDWAYASDQSIDRYAEFSKVPRELALRTRNEFFPKESLQLVDVKGLDATLQQALEFKYINAPLNADEVRKNLIDIVYRPGGS